MKTFNDNLIQVTNLLSHGQFHDGTALGKQLQISRTAVWKIIKKLENYGVPIQSVKGKGYILREPFILLDAKKIIDQLNTTINIEVFESVNSTIDCLQPYLHERKLRCCIAETQTKGRGRFQRQWHSPFGKNVYLSLLYPFDLDMSELSGLSLCVSLAIAKTLTDCYQLEHPITIKWPNDIYYQGKKLAGSLIQIDAETNGFCSAIISAGINVNITDDTTQAISQDWTSIRKENQQFNDRNILCAKLINHFVDYIERFKHGKLNAFMDQWAAHDYLLGKQINICAGNNTVSGTACGISSQGHLILELEGGVKKAFSSGDATVEK